MNLRRKCPRGKIEFARALRKRPTEAELVLWHQLRKRRVGPRFRRQIVIRGWIVDFWCPAAKLIIEVDGRSHVGHGAEDRRRDEALARLGIYTLRLTNRTVFASPGTAVALIERVALERVTR